jgi:hypothetical protein
MRDVVREYGEHPESKSLGPEGRPCSAGTVGLLSRRHIVPSWIQHIGKEANRLEDVERGDVQDWDEVLERFEPWGKGEWEVEILPLLRTLDAAHVAASSGLSIRQVYRLLRSDKHPPSRTAASDPSGPCSACNYGVCQGTGRTSPGVPSRYACTPEKPESLSIASSMYHCARFHMSGSALLKRSRV